MLSTPTSAEIGAAAMAAPILTVSDLAIQFKLSQGWVTAVDGVDFELRRGEVVGIVGAIRFRQEPDPARPHGPARRQRPVYRQRPVSGS